MNAVYLFGRLANDPRLNEEGDSEVVDFKLSVLRFYNKSDGEKGREITYIPCVAYSSAAKNIFDRCEKGTTMLVQGTLKNFNWTSQDGKKGSTLKVRLSSFEIL